MVRVFAAVFLFVDTLHTEYLAEGGCDVALFHVDTVEYRLQIVECVFCDDARVNQLAMAEPKIHIIFLYGESVDLCPPVFALQLPLVFLLQTLVFALNSGRCARLPLPQLYLRHYMLKLVSPRLDTLQNIIVVRQL